MSARATSIPRRACAAPLAPFVLLAFALSGFALLAALFVAAPPAIAADVPYLTGRAVDEANVLSPAARERIEAALAAHEQKTTNQVAVLTVPSLGNDSVEEFAVKVF